MLMNYTRVCNPYSGFSAPVNGTSAIGCAEKALFSGLSRHVSHYGLRIKDGQKIEPCCGSGHILVYVFDLLYKMYEERGYQKRDIPTLILTKNLTGLDVDKRAVQLASFALVMKARSVNNRFFDEKYYVTPHVYELQDSKMLKNMEYRKQLKDLNLLNEKEIKLIDYLVDTFEEGKTIGSLLKVKPIDFRCLDAAIEKIHKQAVSDIFNMDFLGSGMKRLRMLSSLAKVLSAKYDVMITNPPYRPISSMEGAIIDYASLNYPNSKMDMFAMFMETNFVVTGGFLAMINMHSWMFLTSYENLRNSMLSSDEVISMVHLGARAFEEINGEVVQTCAFVERVKFYATDYASLFIRLVDQENQDVKEAMFLSGGNRFIAKQDNFKKIPNTPFAYWASEKIINAYANPKIIDEARPCKGIDTGNNNIFLRLWYEVNFDKVLVPKSSPLSEADFSSHKWYPYNKGGGFRKWYGNNDYVILWGEDGSKLRNYSKSNLRNKDTYFKKGITWSTISSGNSASFRFFQYGFLFDNGGSCLFGEGLDYIGAFLNSKVSAALLSVSPTINTQPGDIGRLPIIKNKKYGSLIQPNVDECISIVKLDWDSFETSWDFIEHPLVSLCKNLWDATAVGASMQYYYGGHPKVSGPVELCYMLWQGECRERFNKLKANEEELNRIFIDIYGLQDELTPDVEDKDVTVRLADKERDIRSLISYLVGLVMGRYSLDVEGLAYAGGEWDASKYIAYQPDDDGIVPIYTKLGMEDGLTTKIIKLIKLIYGEDTYRQNIDFIAEALGKNNNESSEEALNRYLNDGFYQDHLKIYQKRPIYWMFSSGKKAGFKCLIYMHRYNEDTLARINAKYYLPESTRKKNELDELNGRITKAEGREKTRLEKERQNLAAAYNEALEYGQVLDHMANQYIKIDLDDGVKVNYAKFQGVQLVTCDAAF